MNKETHIFKKGQIETLDGIYEIQALAGGDWWKYHHLDNAEYPDEASDTVKITKNITITISWKVKS